MRDFIDWGKCKEEFVRDSEKDPAKINSLIKTAEGRLAFLKSVPYSSERVSFLVEGYYEAIKELLTALLLSHGLRSKNHQCLITYFYKNYPSHEGDAYLIGEMSYLRNRLNYYGEQISPLFYEKNKERIEKIILIIKQLIELK